MLVQKSLIQLRQETGRLSCSAGPAALEIEFLTSTVALVWSDEIGYGLVQRSEFEYGGVTKCDRLNVGTCPNYSTGIVYIVSG